MTTRALITFVLPYFNEADYIGRTLASLTLQTDRRFRLVLVDNASTDDSAAIARKACEALGDIDVRLIEETRPGKLYALVTGLAQTNTPYVGTMDADTTYPPNYVGRTLSAFEADHRTVAVLAFTRMSGTETLTSARSRFFAAWFPRKCHTGGFGQSFQREALERAGGFDPSIWPWVLEDHEIIHRIAKLGPLAYRADHVCYPSDRRSDRSDVSWGLFDRIVYKLLPSALMDWFFYRYLAKKFARQEKINAQLRSKPWKPSGTPG